MGMSKYPRAGTLLLDELLLVRRIRVRKFRSEFWMDSRIGWQVMRNYYIVPFEILA